jgi:two-component system, OmpR family, alkaline phosphatase synthesis response regulator PhoP
MPKGKILVIDDETDLIELVRYNLEKEGYAVVGAGDGESGVALIGREKPDLVIVDLMLPGMDGLEVCRLLRQKPETAQIPILMLTAKSSETDRIIGLELGADDYVTKPFSPRELAARVKALLRRSSGIRKQEALMRHGDLSIDSASHEVRIGNRSIDLTATEYRLLQFLITHPGFVYSRSALIDGALGRDITVLERTIDVHIMSLRKKLGKCGERIETIRGFGYKFRVD